MNVIATQIATSVLLGGIMGLGLWSMLAAIPRWGAQPLMRRIAPYVRDITDPLGTSVATVAPADPGAIVITGAKRSWHWFIAKAAKVWGASDALTLRLTRSGWAITPARFRERQLGAALGAALIGAIAAVGARMAGNPNVGVFVLPVIFAMAAIVAAELLLTNAAAKRKSRIEDELPTILEFIALCLSAGEGLLDAVRRTSSVGVGELSGELRTVVLDVGTGSPLAEALAAFSARIDLPSVQRAVEHLIAALERGAPLAAVLKDQASDARDEHKRAMMERAGKNEVVMLIPIASWF